MKSSVSGLTAAAVALAAGFSLSLNGPHRAYAAPGIPASQSDSDLAVTVLSPTPRTSFSGTKPVEISAFYQGAPSNQIVSIELYVDGSNAYTKKLETPESRGVISFLVDASQLTPGAHRIVVRAVAVDAEVVSAKSSFVYVTDNAGSSEIAPATSTLNGSAPQMTFLSPAAEQKVQGTVHIELQPTEGSTQSPYVSVFVDGQFKTMRNYAPYTYDWDTSSLSNGYHTIEVYAYDESQKVGPAKSIRVYVNNPGGETTIRTDLQDGTSSTGHSSAKGLHAGARVPGDANEMSHPFMPSVLIPKTVGHRAVATQPIDRSLGRAVLPPRSRKSASQDVSPSGLKAIGPFRRPTPRMAMVERKRQLTELRAILMAKRADLLDETGSLDLSSQLSDPFIPDTATKRPTPAQTPTSGFKPLPAAEHKIAAQLPASSVLAAHTVKPVTHMEAALPVAVPAEVQAEHPIAAPVHVQAQHPAVKPAHVEAHAPKAVTPGGSPVMVANAAPMHSVSPASPATIDIHTPTIAEHSADALLATPSIPSAALKPAHVNVATPIAHPAQVRATHPQTAMPVEAVHPLAVMPVEATHPIRQTHLETVHPVTATHIQAAHPISEAPVVEAAHPVAQKHVQMVHISSPVSAATVKHITSRQVRVAALRPKAMAPHISVATPMKIVGTHRVQVHMGTGSLMRARGKSSVFFNNVHVKLDRPIMARHGVLYMPLRQVFEFEGADITWDNKTNTVHSVSESREVILQIGHRHAAVNKSAVKLDGTPFLVNGRTMVPISFVRQALNVDVNVDPVTGHVQLTSKA